MNRKQKEILFIVICLISVFVALFFLNKYQKNRKAYQNIKLEFIQTEKEYEIDSELKAISFIKDTNAVEVDYPEMNTSTVGEHTYVYVAYDSQGNHREFVLSLNITDPIFPVLELTEESLVLYENEISDTFDFKSYILKSYDPVDGELETEINIPDDFQSVGKHKIKYKVIDKNKNITEKVLNLEIKKKEEPKDENVPPNYHPSVDTPNNGSNSEKPAKPVKPDKPPVKDFLFKDGYNQANVQTACVTYLMEHRSYYGSCVPIYDETDGLPIGVRASFK